MNVDRAFIAWSEQGISVMPKRSDGSSYGYATWDSSSWAIEDHYAQPFTMDEAIDPYGRFLFQKGVYQERGSDGTPFQEIVLLDKSVSSSLDWPAPDPTAVPVAGAWSQRRHGRRGRRRDGDDGALGLGGPPWQVTLGREPGARRPLVGRTAHRGPRERIAARGRRRVAPGRRTRRRSPAVRSPPPSGARTARTSRFSTTVGRRCAPSARRGWSSSGGTRNRLCSRREGSFSRGACSRGRCRCRTSRRAQKLLGRHRLRGPRVVEPGRPEARRAAGRGGGDLERRGAAQGA